MRLTSTAPNSLAPLAALWDGPFDQAWSELPGVARTGRSGFECAHGSRLFDFLATHPDDAHLFDRAMQGLIRTVSKRVADEIALDSPETLCDVGGGNGALLIDAINRSPEMSGILHDRADVLASAIGAPPDRSFRLIPGDFFEKVPRASAHMLANILHDWPDSSVARILDRVAAAQPDDGIIYVVEPMLGGSDEPVMACQFDLHMMMLTGGRERSRDHLKALLAAAGYEIERVVPLGDVYSFMKAVRASAPLPRTLLAAQQGCTP